MSRTGLSHGLGAPTGPPGVDSDSDLPVSDVRIEIYPVTG